MKVATFFADCELPPEPKRKSAGFDWHRAIGELRCTVRASLGVETMVVTDERTAVEGPALRVGDARAEGVMLWLLDAQAEAIRTWTGQLLMVSPDTLIAGRLDVLFGDWDVCLLTRARPKPIVNSVIAVRANAAVAARWDAIARAARAMPADSRAWGADIDALVDAFAVRPREDGIREAGDLRVRLLPIDGVFRSAAAPQPQRLAEPIWDFKGARKAWMPGYAALL